MSRMRNSYYLNVLQRSNKQLYLSPFKKQRKNQPTGLADNSSDYWDLISFTKDKPNYRSGYNLQIAHLVPYPQLDLNTKIFKRLFDIFFSLIIMIIGVPVFGLLYLITKFSSQGPAFYKQERMGKDNNPFFIYKFRSMHLDAEKMGPQLSSANDSRITSWGRVIRSTRLDELPQFWNVLKGEMSIVGPRPERRHFIEQIIERNPNYRKLQRLKPGVTSLGQIHFGYAENVEEMCERMMFDLHYIQRINLYTDMSIIARTLKVMAQCKGK